MCNFSVIDDWFLPPMQSTCVCVCVTGHVPEDGGPQRVYKDVCVCVCVTGHAPEDGGPQRVYKGVCV